MQELIISVIKKQIPHFIFHFKNMNSFCLPDYCVFRYTVVSSDETKLGQSDLHKEKKKKVIMVF